MQTIAAAHFRTKLLFGDRDWTEYDFTAELMGGGDASLYFCIAEQGEIKNTNLIEFNIRENGCEVAVYENGAKRMLPWAGPATAKWYTARVKVRRNRIECSLIDDTGHESPIALDESSEHPKGRIGLGTFNALGSFRKIRVKDPNGKDLWTGLPVLKLDGEQYLAGVSERPKRKEKARSDLNRKTRRPR